MMSRPMFALKSVRRLEHLLVVLDSAESRDRDFFHPSGG